MHESEKSRIFVKAGYVEVAFIFSSTRPKPNSAAGQIILNPESIDSDLQI